MNINVGLISGSVPCKCTPGASPHDAVHLIVWDDDPKAFAGRVHIRIVCATGLDAVLREAYASRAEHGSIGKGH
jgi:hypothetical protein